jgi:hypothetical protein
MDTLGIEPRASRMLSGCDTTTPRALDGHSATAHGPSKYASRLWIGGYDLVHPFAIMTITCNQPEAKRHRGDSNPCGQSPMDFESISLTARTQCHACSHLSSHDAEGSAVSKACACAGTSMENE